jgi:hypothetical protein
VSTVTDLLIYLAAATALVAAASRWRSIRPATPTRAQRHLLIALAAIAPALALVAPATQAAITPIEPFGYATAMLSCALAMLAAYCVVAMLAHLVTSTGRRTAWRPVGHIATLIGTVATMTGLLLVADVDAQDDLTTAAGQHPLLAAHQLVYFAYLGACTTRFILLLRRYLARPDARPLMRRGIGVVVTAAIVGQVWLAWKILTQVLAAANWRVVDNPAAIAHLLGVTATILIAAGSTLPVWGSWLQRTIHRWRVERALRDITPLWRLLATMLPDISLRQAVLVHPEVLLYRRVIEIRDAERRLLGYAHPHTDRDVLLACTREHRIDKIAIRTEAAALATAINAYRAGHRTPADPARVHYPYTRHLDPLAEARWLIQVYAAMRYDRIVARIVDRARRQLRGAPNIQHV